MSSEMDIIIKNKYKILKQIGKGGTGNVYLVEEIKNRKKFVLKERLLPEQANLDKYTINEVFFREAEFLCNFELPGIPDIIEVFREKDFVYIAMEYIEGKTLEEIINSSTDPIAEKKAIKWAIEIADILISLDKATDEPLVYRDLKPSNIIITPEEKAILIDFGTIRYYSPEKYTDTFRLGSPGYAAPEQYEGEVRLPPRQMYSVWESYYFRC